MTRLLSRIFVLFVAMTPALGVASDPPEARPKVAASICTYTTHDWSTMRAMLEQISRYKGKVTGDVQQVARRALAGSTTHQVGDFALEYGPDETARPAPNKGACYVRRLTFAITRDDGADDEAAFACVAKLDPSGKLQSLTCELTAG